MDGAAVKITKALHDKAVEAHRTTGIGAVITHRGADYEIRACVHEAGGYTEGCLGCAPFWGYYLRRRIPGPLLPDGEFFAVQSDWWWHEVRFKQHDKARAILAREPGGG